MPNHVTNVLEIIGDGSDDIFKLIQTQEEDFLRLIDFNKIIPMPKSLKIESSSHSELFEWIEGGKQPDWAIHHYRNKEVCLEEMKDYYKDKPEKIDELREIGKTRIRNKQLYGCACWYDWAPNNWGTKWNAYDAEQRGEKIKFETAWATPFHIFETLSAHFPNVLIVVNYADEDISYNCGIIKFKGGIWLEDESDVSPRDRNKEEQRKWTKFAFELVYPNEDPKKNGYDENWDYSEELYLKHCDD